MKQSLRFLFTSLCFGTMLLAGGAMKVRGAELSQESIRVHGPVISVGDGRLSIRNDAPDSYPGEMVLNIVPNYTRILDAVTGNPILLETLKPEDSIYAYIGNTMTMSLPPMTNASLILANIPADFKVPDYLEVESLTFNPEKTAAILVAANGTQYTVPADVSILPYLTRNIVTLDDLVKGRQILLWSDAANQANKIIVFPEIADRGSSDDTTNQPPKSGWVNDEGNWLFYGTDGQPHTGWLLDNGNWYFLDPSDGVMHTGFITLDGNTYYLQDNGALLTTPRTFTPDASGVLH